MNSRKKVLCSVLAGFLAFLMLFSLFSMLISSHASDKTDLKKLKDKLSEIKSERKEKENELAQVKAEVNSTLERKYAVEQEIALIYDQIHLTEQLIEALDEDIQIKTDELAAVEKTKDAQYETFKRRLRAQYESNGISSLELILSSSSMTEALTRVEELNRIANYDNEIIDDLNESIAYIDSLKTVLEEDKADQEEQKKEYEQYNKELEDQEAELEDIIEELNEKVTLTQAEIAEISANERAVDNDIKKLSAKIAAEEAAAKAKAAAAAAAAAAKDNANKNSGSSGSSSGSMSWPLPGYRNVTSDYKMRTNPVTGVYSHHTGIDISAPKNTKIKAAASGTVVSAGWNDAYGNRIIISHGDGVQTLYAHMTSFAVSEGDSVSAGDTIGYVGSTGNSTGNHLHFSVLESGNYVNPWNYVS